MLRRFLERFLNWLGASLFRRMALGIAVVLITLGVGALAVTSAGLVSISASSGHWPITSWFLHYSMRRAVSTQSLGIKVPKNLDDPSMILKGAGHYENGCLACHGAPGRSQSLIVQQMTPEPPYLPPRIEHWEPEELFWIVRHGIKFTAMPAWPALKRDDEVWAVVAFLRQLPDMSPERYQELAFGERADAEPAAAPVDPERLRTLVDPLGPVLANCARCHGPEGGGRGTGAFPILAGQNEAYLLASLKAYATGDRASGVMQPIAARLDEKVLEQLAAFYAKLPPQVSYDSAKPDPAAVARGSELAAVGARERKVPSCVHCHGPAASERNPMYPDLAGQYPEYLTLQLRLFAAGERGGTEYANIMHTAAQRLTPEQMRDLADFYASLEPSDEPKPGP